MNERAIRKDSSTKLCFRIENYTKIICALFRWTDDGDIKRYKLIRGAFYDSWI